MTLPTGGTTPPTNTPAATPTAPATTTSAAAPTPTPTLAPTPTPTLTPAPSLEPEPGPLNLAKLLEALLAAKKAWEEEIQNLTQKQKEEEEEEERARRLLGFGMAMGLGLPLGPLLKLLENLQSVSQLHPAPGSANVNQPKGEGAAAESAGMTFVSSQMLGPQGLGIKLSFKDGSNVAVRQTKDGIEYSLTDDLQSEKGLNNLADTIAASGAKQIAVGPGINPQSLAAMHMYYALQDRGVELQNVTPPPGLDKAGVAAAIKAGQGLLTPAPGTEAKAESAQDATSSTPAPEQEGAPEQERAPGADAGASAGKSEPSARRRGPGSVPRPPTTPRLTPPTAAA